ncbi:MAG TPA: hypothetical protein VMY76_04155 [Gemmatimonadales bacterium]|nr:hypothetical protein [Gemmatimonadales bacterium]
MTLRRGRTLALVVLVVALGTPASAAFLVAQDTAAGVSAQPPADTASGSPPRAAGDSLAIRTSPMNAFWRSFLLPGWGQAKLGRKLTAGIFVAWEGTTLGMSLKTRRELGYLRRTNSARAEDKRREHEDWLVLLAFNHLFAGLEAYVSGHLTDFPGDLRIRAAPGGIGGSVTIPFRLR